MTLDEVRAAVERILQQRGGRVLFSQLGADLRREIPGFSHEYLGFRKFSEFVASLNDLGAVVRGDAPEAVWLIAAGASSLTPPRSAAAEANHPLRLRRDIWDAVTDYAPGERVWFDLGSERVTFDAAAVAQNPDRYIAVPRFDMERQRQLAAQWIAHSPAGTLRDELTAALDGERGLQTFARTLRERGMDLAWSEWRGEQVAEAVRTWAHEYGVDPASMAPPRERATVAPRRAPTPRTHPPASSDGAERLRAFLHRALDGMTLGELMAVPVPARLVFELDPEGT